MVLTAAEAVAVSVCVLERTLPGGRAHPEKCRYCSEDRIELLARLDEWRRAGEPGRTAYEHLPSAEQTRQREAAQQVAWYEEVPW